MEESKRKQIIDSYLERVLNQGTKQKAVKFRSENRLSIIGKCIWTRQFSEK